MKIKDVFLKNGADDFIQRCVFNGVEYDNTYKKELYKIIHKSQNVDEFISLYLSTENFKNRQAYAVLSKEFRPDENWYRIRKMLGINCVKTFSDAGGIKIGNDNFSLVIPNGVGDGITRFAILNHGEWNSSFLRFFTKISGDKINIYSYDCGNEIIKTISGEYGVFYGEGFIVLEKWGWLNKKATKG